MAIQEKQRKRSKAKELREAVKRLLIPHIIAAGFENDTREIWNDDDLRHLTDRFLRRHGKELDLLEIQYDQHGRAAFRIEFGAVPSNGVNYCGYHYSQRDATVYVTNRATLHPSRINRLKRFGFPTLRIPLLRNPSADAIVAKSVELYPQIEAWLADGIKGPNVSIVPTVSKRVL